MSPNNPKSRPVHAGVDTLLFRVLLVAGIAFNLLYLTSDLGLRADLTEEKLYSLSPSTKRILGELDEGLVLEAYFRQQMPGPYREDRRKILDLLDEYVQLGRGKVKLVFFDPTEDKAIADRARRLGIDGIPVQVVEASSIQTEIVWQGLRIRYGGDKQQVIPVIQGSLALEETLTPLIHQLVQDRKPKVAVVARGNDIPPSPFQREQPPPAPAWSLVTRSLQGRFELVQPDFASGDLLPEDLDLLVVIEPKKLTDWEKYCIDQHLMRGGDTVVFADSVDYVIEPPRRMYEQKPYPLDSEQDTKLHWRDQLASYGVDWNGRVVLENYGQLTKGAPVFRFGPSGRLTGYDFLQMPYWFSAARVDWSSYAKDFAQTPEGTAELAKTLASGIALEHPVFHGMDTVAFYWGTEVGLTKTLPEGVEGSVLLRTSPAGLSQDPPQSTNMDDVNLVLEIKRLAKAEARQVPLCVVLQGRFPSAFARLPVPKRPGDDKNGGLLAQDPATQDPATQDPAAQDPAAQDPAAQDQPAAEQGDAPAPGQDPDQGGFQGPPVPEHMADQPGREPLPAKLDTGRAECRLFVVGDASMIRDDHLDPRSNPLGQFGTTYWNQAGAVLFNNIVDWMALDLDLVELRTRRGKDRKLDFASEVFGEQETADERKARAATTKAFLKWGNTLLPVLVLLGYGAWTLIRRGAEKRAFLSSTEAN